MKPPPSPAVEALKKASKGLRMPSETDAPFRAFQWDDAGDLTHDRLLALAHQPKDTAVEETDLATLFQTVPKASRPKFQALRDAGKAHQIESVGAELRAMMPFISAGKTRVQDASGG